MDSKQAIKEIVELMGDSNYTDVWSGASNEPMNMALDLAIEALEAQCKIKEVMENLVREYDNYDSILIIEVKDILNELIID